MPGITSHERFAVSMLTPELPKIRVIPKIPTDAIIKNIQRLEAVKELFIEKFKASEDKEIILQSIGQVDKFIWNIGKRKADPELYQMLQHKLLTLGLSDEPIMSADDLDYTWQMEIHEEQDIDY